MARPWPGLQMPGLCNTRSTSSRKACNPDVYVGHIEKVNSDQIQQWNQMIPVPRLCCPWHLSPRRSCCTCQDGCCMGRKKIGCFFEKNKNLSAIFQIVVFKKRVWEPFCHIPYCDFHNKSLGTHIVLFKNNLSAQSFASCTPTFRRPPRSHLLPTYNLENYFVANL